MPCTAAKKRAGCANTPRKTVRTGNQRAWGVLRLTLHPWIWASTTCRCVTWSWTWVPTRFWRVNYFHQYSEGWNLGGPEGTGLFPEFLILRSPCPGLLRLQNLRDPPQVIARTHLGAQQDWLQGRWASTRVSFSPSGQRLPFLWPISLGHDLLWLIW